MIGGTTRVCAVIGDPIKHSLSPPMHNAAFRSLGMDLVYVAFRVRKDELRAAIEGIRSLGILGVNVTMPHKTRVLRFLDKVDVTAREIGAVNTIVRSDSELHGYNTDGQAALASLASLGCSLSGSAGVILGAGGAARSIAYHLCRVVESLTILNRTRSKASSIAGKARMWSGARCRSHRLDRTSLRQELSEASLLINTLPVHVFPRIGKTLIEQRLVRPGMLVLDINYQSKNDFLAEAKLAGAKVSDGLDMLVRQAALSFRIWTGRDAPIEIMREAAIKARRTCPK